ncbi:amino acid adenylation domain-containing protein [Gordonia malaquae]|uniref:amino acid adenylation domain-containing protein n=1 Tax=Gordonia malaquae TaxID=410332 RepID=UPI0030C795E6
MNDLPLNRAQRALWFAQQMVGDRIPIVVAQCLDIEGPLDAGTLAACVDEVCADLGVSSTRLVVDGRPILSGDVHSRPRLTETVSMINEDDPERAAVEWMAAATREPVDLAGPLLRCVLLELGPSRWTFYARAHHILLDGYAAGLMMRHVAHRYRTRVGSAADSSAPPSPRGIDAILDHEQTYLVSNRRLRDSDYWRDVMAAAPAPLRFAPRTVGPSSSSHVVGVDLNVSSASELGQVAVRAGVPTVAVLVAGCAVGLSRISDRSSIPLTLVTSGRTTAAVRAAAGTMSNLLPILIEQVDAESVDTLLRAVAATLSEALRHQCLRFEEIVADHERQRLGPVVNLVPSIPDVSLGDGVRAELRVLTTGPVDDVNINVYPGGADTLRIEIEVNAEAHDVAFAEALLGDVVGGVRALSAAKLDAPIVGLDVTEPTSALVGEPSDRMRTLADEYLRHRRRDRVAVIDADGREHTYAALAERTADIARSLRERARPGAVIAVVCERSVHSVVAAWAVAAAGMCVLPIDPTLPEKRRRTMLGDARPALVLGLGSAADINLADLAVADRRTPGESIPPGVRHNAAAYLLYTSGSTGTPKGIVVTHSGIGALVDEMDDHYCLDDTSVVAHLASPGFDTAIVEMLAAAHAGAALVIVPPEVRGGADLESLLESRGVTHLFVTPAVLATLPAEGLPNLTHLIVGGDVCPAPLIRRWARTRTVRCAYGPTETTCSVTLTDPIDPDGVEPQIPLGEPMRGVRIHLLDRRLRPVPRGGEGELYVAGPSLARGVVGPTGRTADRFIASVDGDGGRMYRTGDRVRRGVDDRLWFLGRGDGQVKINGVRVEPAETDRAVLATGLVTGTVTVAHHTESRISLHTYVVPATGVDTEDLARRVRESVRDAAGSSYTPAGVTLLDELPLTVNNKIDASALPPPVVGERRRFRAPSTEVEQAVVDAFERALGADRVGIDDDFFDLAGDSLSATAVAADINGRLGVSIGVRDVFESGTPLRIADLIDAIAREQSQPALSSDGPVPISPVQRTVFEGRGRIDHLIAFEVTVPGFMSTADARGLVGSLLDAHPMLRSRFADDATFTVDSTADPDRWRIESLADGSDMRRRLHEPIDVASGYPIRVVIAPRVAATQVGFAFHHLAVDGESLRILASSLTEPPRARDGDYRDYARLATARADMHRAADIAHFAPTASIVVDLAAVTRRRPVWDDRGARVSYPIEPGQWAAVGDAAQEHRVTELTVLRATLAGLVSARSGARAVPIGALISGRDDTRWDGVVGMFVNTVSVLCRMSASWPATVEAVRKAENEAFAHSATAFTDVVDALGPSPTDRHPLFQVMLTMDRDPGVPGVHVTPYPVDIARCDLHVSIVAPTRGAVGRVEILYASALFDQAYVERLAADLVGSFSDLSGAGPRPWGERPTASRSRGPLPRRRSPA